MFVGFEGTPWFGWVYTAYLSFVLIGLFTLALKERLTRSRNGLFLSVILIPLILVIGASFFKPLFVNRYLIFVTVGEIFLVAFAIQAIKNAWVQKALALSILLFLFWFNAWFPTQHAKFEIRPIIEEVNTLALPNDYIYADDPLLYMEIKYYAAHREHAFLYNVSGSVFPWYIGDAIVAKENIKSDLPLYPHKAFIVHRDGTYTIMYQSPLVK